MDGSRESDLYVLHRVLNDPTSTVIQKRNAHTAITRIKRKIHDPTIKALRHRLIGASRAGDAEESWKISEALQDYERRVYGRG